MSEKLRTHAARALVNRAALHLLSEDDALRFALAIEEQMARPSSDASGDVAAALPLRQDVLESLAFAVRELRLLEHDGANRVEATYQRVLGVPATERSDHGGNR